LDVQNRHLLKRPQDAHMFMKASGEQTANGYDIGSAKIVSVVRESGTNDDWRDCVQISPGMQSRVTDTSSLVYSSKYNPSFTVLDEGGVHVYPAASSGGADSYKIYYVNNVPVNESDAALDNTHSDIAYFPKDMVYLVVLYAAIKSLETKLTSVVIDDEDIELVSAMNNSVTTFKQQYETMFRVAPQQHVIKSDALQRSPR